MNTGMVVSFIIGGLLLISIIAMNSRVLENSGETVLNMSAKQTVETVTQVMTRDFLRIGYNTGEEPNKAIMEISDPNSSVQKIVFKADIDDDANTPAVKITWTANKNADYTPTDKDHDFELKRTVHSGPESGTSTFGVTDFQFKFLNQNDSPTTDASKVNSIRVMMESEAPSRYGNRKNFEKSVWKKTFTPPNLNFQAYND